MDIVLSTLNSSYFHSAFGLRYVYANLEELQSRAQIAEFTTAEKASDIVETLLKLNPKIVGFSVYIWNTKQVEECVSILKRVRPDIFVVLGGPEISFETETQNLYSLCDYVVVGEAEFLFRDLCRDLLSGKTVSQKLIRGPLPNVLELKSPYPYYTDDDIKNRVIYVEASRGCPYKCEFCLSSLDKEVRQFPIQIFLSEMQTLIDRGVRQFKFVDRTFNLNFAISKQILNFFLSHIEKGLFLHFEMVPDRLPEELKALIKQFPAGSMQFEIGVQTLNDSVAKLISRRQDLKKTEENFKFLTTETRVHIHSDLIVGLPGETLSSFREGFDRLSAMNPHEIQVGILKRLKGTPIIRHDSEFKMVYDSNTPYSILQTSTLSFTEVQKLSRFAKFWDLYANSGNFVEAMGLIKHLSSKRTLPSLFDEFWDFTSFLELRHPKRHSLALLTLVESFWIYLTKVREVSESVAREALIQDYSIRGKRDIPKFLREEGTLTKKQGVTPSLERATPRRQTRHLTVIPQPSAP